jgi:protein-L-isoaspartate(D-aspartate) O-methyltransferase
VIPVGQSNAVQHLIVARKAENGVEYEELCPVRFVPLLEGLGQDG